MFWWTGDVLADEEHETDRVFSQDYTAVVDVLVDQ